MNKVILRMEGLKTLQSRFQQGAASNRVQVGIFSNHNARRKDPLTNAEIGAIHEFGSLSDNIPQRSFLLMPLMFHLGGNLNALVNWNVWLMKGGFTHALRRLGQAAEKTIDNAFATGGFGFWPALKKNTVRKKGHAKILIETSQLRKSVSSRVV